MMGNDFLTGLAKDVANIERRARDQFGPLTEDQLNWSPEPGRWSIAQCLDHLLTANESYFPSFNAVATGTHKPTFWERLPVWPSICGTLIVNTVHPKTTRKTKAPKIYHVSASHLPADVLDRFCAQQQKLRDIFASLEGVDVDKTIVTSPVAVFVPYSLRDALLIVTLHEERHMQQAERVLRRHLST